MISEGTKLTCIDNMATVPPANVQHLMKPNRFSLIQCDVAKPMKFSGKFDQIYNLACPASPPAYQAAPIQTTKTSVFGAINVLELAREHDAPVFQASTSELYAHPLP